MMRVTLTFTSVALIVAGATVGAQGQGQAGGRGQGAQANAAPSRPPDTYDPSKTQIVQGCLKPSATAGMFQLSDAVEMKGGAASGSKQTLAIVGVIPPTVKLKDHVNHKVQLTGTIGDGGRFGMADFKMLSTTCP
jgi:hypothetical protein